MSASKDANSPINRAHALSAKASQTAQISGTAENLSKASELYGEAADLFEQVKKDASDSGAVATLTLLAAQNRKKAKDLARRATIARNPKASTAAISKEPDVPTHDRQRRRRMGGPTEPSPQAAAPVHTFSPALPFARPIPIISAAMAASSGQMHKPASSSGSNPAYTESKLKERPSVSELGLASGDSFVKFGHPLESSDPFARFWAVLETAFDQMSNPVAFAAAPLDVQRVGKKAKGKGREDEPVASVPEPTSPSSADSFEVIHKKPIGAKTPEELALENEHLRASLDALSKHTMQVEQALKRVKDREGMMKSVVLGVKAEAQKVMQSQELYRSAMMPSSRLGVGAGVGGAALGRPADSAQRRIVDLEEQVKFLQAENERARSHLQKYKDRFEKLKTSARAKKEAKLMAEGGHLATLGEEDGE
ncbi:hypothetical protein HD553DRAFT_2341 [Filobasidium floriforme]|uniref:uncharacterized protein n=1 Tax=Filobasidium floriforme TaxID=5210 RepID=UPI001E8EEF1D|nr:uncharacterized protein HD553DRAFT_2341 [Filobasidium floriforme]KAH8090361.1 hypothetical protein HD553DRAFT_2341 [Filobasidium floriforme]